MEVILANPRGFCAGVDRAIDIVDRALELFGAPVYVRHEVVHNRFVVDGLRERGAIFVDELEEIPDGATVVFSAHGVSSAVQQAAEGRELRVFDATCPLVTKVHLEVARYARDDVDVILIGHAGHPEVQCHVAELVLVVGSPNSSNSNRLREIAERAGRTAYLINGAEDIEDAWLAGIDRVGITAGASAPEVLVDRVVAHLRSRGADRVRSLDGAVENIVFPLPRLLRTGASSD